MLALAAPEAGLVEPVAGLIAPEAELVAPEASVAPEAELVAPEVELVAPEVGLVASEAESAVLVQPAAPALEEPALQAAESLLGLVLQVPHDEPDQPALCLEFALQALVMRFQEAIQSNCWMG